MRETATHPADHQQTHTAPAETRLGPRATAALAAHLHADPGTDQDTSPAPFLIAGVAALLARMDAAEKISICYRERVYTLNVDLSGGFAGLAEHAASVSPARSNTAVCQAILTLAHQTKTEAGTIDHPVSIPHITARRVDQTWSIQVSAAQWSHTRCLRTSRYLVNLLEAASADPSAPLNTLRLMEEAEALDACRALNQTAASWAPYATLLDPFAEQVAAHAPSWGPGPQAAPAGRFPSNVEFPSAVEVAGKSAVQFPAVQYNDRTLTYAELDAQSTALARVLSSFGASQQHPVALCLPRSEQVPVSMLAAMKAGSYYVPLDPTHPRQRLLDILEECTPAVVLVSPQTRTLFAGSALPLLDPVNDPVQYPINDPIRDPINHLTNPPDATHPGVAQRPCKRPRADDIAYMIYTSGTTGKPKGVMVQHGSLLNVLMSLRQRPGLAAGDRMLGIATFSFDISIVDIFLPLIAGATAVIAPEQAARDPWVLSALLANQRITCMQATPVTWRMLLAAKFEKKDLKIISGGEALSRDLANDLLESGADVWNSYGPTETAIYSSTLPLHKTEGRVPIGPPLANTQFYVVDAAGQPVPPGIAGELWIGGAGVAAGYYQRPELTRERFLANPWPASDHPQPSRLFRTGDLVRMVYPGSADPVSADQALSCDQPVFEFLGRIDHQVKLRGYRIELDEIESILRSRPSLSGPGADAAVILREDQPGEPWLVAYVTGANQPSNTAASQAAPFLADPGAQSRDLLQFAAQRLPAYMLPARIVFLSSLPSTPSGKVDRRALSRLPAPVAFAASGQAAPARPQAPLNAVEAKLLRIFREVLHQPGFGPDEDFFAGGGYSMLAMRLFARIRAVLHQDLPITALFDAPSVRRLAALLEQSKPLDILVPIRPYGHRPPVFLVHSYLLYELMRDVVDEGRPVFGLRESAPSGEAASPAQKADWRHSLGMYVSAIEANGTGGPIHLAGWCAAAPLTIEIARALQARGKTLGVVALFDAAAPAFSEQSPHQNRLLARLRAMRKFHLGRMRAMNLKERALYLLGRLRQAPLTYIERFYLANREAVARWGRAFPWLPGFLFYNRYTQIAETVHEPLVPLDVRIQLFRARDVPILAGSDPALGWGRIALQGVDVSFIPGHHESMFLPPNKAVLAREFQRRLLRSEPAAEPAAD